MDLTEKTISSTTIYDGKILSLKKDEIVLCNGEKSFREVVHNSGGACVLAEIDGFIYFVKQYRYAHQKMLLELPAGKLNEGESPKDCAFRELTEETGLVADEMVLLSTIYPTPAYTDEVIYIYLAKGLKHSKMNLDDDEFLTVEKISIEKVKKKLSNGEICDGKTVVGLYSYFNKF